MYVKAIIRTSMKAIIRTYMKAISWREKFENLPQRGGFSNLEHVGVGSDSAMKFRKNRFLTTLEMSYKKTLDGVL